MEQKKRINEGYEIIKARPIGNVEFVVGENIHDRTRYVTWEYSKTGGYYWGHYFGDKQQAIEDMYNRAEEELSYIRSKDVPDKDKNKEEREER